MALIILRKKKSTTTAPTKTTGFSWDQWYAKNKKRLSESKAKRYQEDKEYRDAALKRGRSQRKSKPVTSDVSALLFPISFVQMAGKLGITVWVLREWRKKDYFPEPHHRNGRLWFKPEQQTLLTMLQKFFDTYGPRVTDTKKEKLKDVVALVYANW